MDDSLKKLEDSLKKMRLQISLLQAAQDRFDAFCQEKPEEWEFITKWSEASDEEIEEAARSCPSAIRVMAGMLKTRLELLRSLRDQQLFEDYLEEIKRRTP